MFKTIGTLHKIYWDFVVDWGLFAETESEKTPLFLRDKRKYSPSTYYLCMIYDIFGLFFWAIVLKLYSLSSTEMEDDSLASLEFYSNIMWITWLEMIVAAVRRTIWVFIRVENEYFSNVEHYRDIVIVPPILKDDS